MNTFLGRFGGATNCLLVAVTPRELVVTPRFPFTLMFFPEVYGLEFSAPRSRVRIEKISTGMFGGHLIVAVDGSAPNRMELKLRDKVRFNAALAAQ